MGLLDSAACSTRLGVHGGSLGGRSHQVRALWAIYNKPGARGTNSNETVFFNSTGPPAGFIGRTPLTVACVQVTPRGPWGGEPIKSGHLEPFTSPGWAPAGPGHRFAAGARPALTTKRAGETA